jgi:hypothetical protein
MSTSTLSPALLTTPAVCTRCQHAPRLPKQRWCRACLTAAQRQRRADKHRGQVGGAFAPVTHAAMQEMSYVPQGNAQAPATALPDAQQGRTAACPPALAPKVAQAAGASAGVTQAQRQALLVYQAAVQEYEARRTIKPGWLSRDRSAILNPLALRVERARQRLAILGIDPQELKE